MINPLTVALAFLCLISSLFGTEEYRLKVGDKLLLGLYGEPLSQHPVEVGPTGTINYQNVRYVPALGRTIAEVRTEINDKLKSYYRFPKVTLTATQFIGNHYTVMGEVRAPGIKPLVGNPTILTGLCEAGGFTTRLYRDQTIDVVDLDHSFLVHDGEYVPVDFHNLVQHGDLSQDKPLHPGDIIFLASYIMPRVYVLGEVNHGVTIDYLETISLAEALAEAGGLTLRASSRVIVVRGALNCPTVYSIDINRILKGYECNFWLEPGDIVYVPAFKFTHIKEYLQAAVAAFVSTTFSVAGTNTFLEITPKAKNTSVLAPAQVIDHFVGGTATVNVAPDPDL